MTLRGDRSLSGHNGATIDSAGLSVRGAAPAGYSKREWSLGATNLELGVRRGGKLVGEVFESTHIDAYRG